MALYTKEDVEQAIADDEIAGWKARRYRTFRATMTDEEESYPCYFATDAQLKGYFRYTFPGDPTDEEQLAELGSTLKSFVDDHRKFGEYPALIAMFEPPEEEQSATEYKRQFWDILEYLQDADPDPWPASTPTDPYHPKWQYCYGGVPLFLVARAPFYEARKSRFTPHGLEITFQPWTNFEGLTGMDDEGQRARTRIRKRLAEYDDVEKHPDAGDLDDPRKLEWQEYMVPDNNIEGVVRFPLSERSDVENEAGN